jgi:hypothetical protein
MRRWLTLGLLWIVACDPEVERSYNTGENGTPGTNPTDPEQTNDARSCDELCDAVETDDDLLCIVQQLANEGVNLALVPRCPSWLNYYDIDTDDCIICATDLNLSDADCDRYGAACGL